MYVSSEGLSKQTMGTFIESKPLQQIAHRRQSHSHKKNKKEIFFSKPINALITPFSTPLLPM